MKFGKLMTLYDDVRLGRLPSRRDPLLQVGFSVRIALISFPQIGYGHYGLSVREL